MPEVLKLPKDQVLKFRETRNPDIDYLNYLKIVQRLLEQIADNSLLNHGLDRATKMHNASDIHGVIFPIISTFFSLLPISNRDIIFAEYTNKGKWRKFAGISRISTAIRYVWILSSLLYPKIYLVTKLWRIIFSFFYNKNKLAKHVFYKNLMIKYFPTFCFLQLLFLHFWYIWKILIINAICCNMLTGPKAHKLIYFFR